MVLYLNAAKMKKKEGKEFYLQKFVNTNKTDM